MDKLLRNPRTILLFLLPALVLYVGIVILPLGISGAFSALSWDGIGAPSFVGLENYGTLLGLGRSASGSFGKALANSLVLTVLTLLIQIPLALVLALVLAKGVKGEGFFRTAFFMPVILSSVVIGLLWRRVYDPHFGLLMAFFKAVGATAPTTSFLGDEKTALYAVCAPIIWQWIGYHMLLLYAAAKAVPVELREAAILEGAGEALLARKVTIPLMAPVIKICVTLAVIGSVKTFDLVFVLTNGGPAHASEVPSTLMVTTLFKKYQYGLGSAMAILIVAVCLVLTVLIHALFRTQEQTY